MDEQIKKQKYQAPIPIALSLLTMLFGLHTFLSFKGPGDYADNAFTSLSMYTFIGVVFIILYLIATVRMQPLQAGIFYYSILLCFSVIANYFAWSLGDTTSFQLISSTASIVWVGYVMLVISVYGLIKTAYRMNKSNT